MFGCREQFPVRDTGNPAEKGVSLHRTSVFLYPAVAIQVFPLEKVCRCTEPLQTGSFPSATQGISQKRVCRCIVLLFFQYPAVAIQVFPLERVCRCMEPQKERRFPSAIHGILRKRVCRCIVPLLFLYPAVAIQVFLLKGCVAARNRCRPAVSRPRHRESCRKGCVAARSLCTNPLHRTAVRTERKGAFCFLLSEGRVRNCF